MRGELDKAKQEIDNAMQIATSLIFPHALPTICGHGRSGNMWHLMHLSLSQSRIVMDNELTKQRIDDAMGIAKELLKSRSKDSALPMIIEQLNYLKEIYDRDRSFKTVPANKMTFGLIAAKNYDMLYPKFADILYNISWALDHQD
jgi:hypothetical protein